MRKALPVALAIGAVIALAGCVDAGLVDQPTPSPTVPPPDTLGPETDAAECEDIIPAALVATFTQARWTPETEAWSLGGQEIPGALLCSWGTTDGVPSAVFGYGEPTPEQADAARAELESEGWQLEPADTGTYATEQAGGPRYLFHDDGSVRYADVAESVDLVAPPR